MARYAVQIVTYPTSNLAEDATVGSWSCEAADSAAALLFTNAVITEYSNAVAMFPSSVRQVNHVYKIFNRADPTPRVPVLQGIWNFPAAPTGDPLPPEVAHCLSFQGAATSGVPQARRRGRIYFGPLDIARVGADGRPSAIQMTAMDLFGTNLLAASIAAPTWLWTVHSTITPAPGSDVEVLNGWVDDEFDTQRRRGRRATTRATF